MSQNSTNWVPELEKYIDLFFDVRLEVVMKEDPLRLGVCFGEAVLTH